MKTRSIRGFWRLPLWFASVHAIVAGLNILNYLTANHGQDSGVQYLIWILAAWIADFPVLAVVAPMELPEPAYLAVYWCAGTLLWAALGVAVTIGIRRSRKPERAVAD